MNDDEGKQLLSDLVNAINNGNQDEINRLKYKNLFYGYNLYSVISNYIFLCKNLVGFDFGYQIIKKGTKLYRIRLYDEKVDYNNPKEWSYPPLMPENRANKKGEPALYLGTTEKICLLETHIKQGEKYVLGEYELVEDLKLGGFINSEDNKKPSWYQAGVILNACLVAPSRNEKNKELFEYLDSYYKDFTFDDLQISEVNKIDLPLKFAKINNKNEFYKITNRILEHIKSNYTDGISYSSSFIPVPTVGITCTDHNVALYVDGMRKIKVINHSIKTNEQNYTGLDILKILIEVAEKQKEIPTKR